MKPTSTGRGVSIPSRECESVNTLTESRATMVPLHPSYLHEASSSILPLTETFPSSPCLDYSASLFTVCMAEASRLARSRIWRVKNGSRLRQYCAVR